MKKVYVGKSGIAGRGVFAAEIIWPGQQIFRFEGPRKYMVNKQKIHSLADPNWVGVRRNVWIEPSGMGQIINHSCRPNAGVRGLTVHGRRKILPDREITIDYSTIECDALWEMLCSCGAPNCRRSIGPVDSLPRKQFNSYLPYVPAYFRRYYENRHKKKPRRV